jgi:hypothetical protein
MKRKSGLVPAAARVPLALSDADQALSDEAVQTFVAEVGGRHALTGALAVGATSPDVQQIVRLLLDPRYDQTSLPRLCRLAGLTVADFFVAYRKALVARSHIAATHLVAGQILTVVQDILHRAAPHHVPCDACYGCGSITPSPTRQVPNPSPGPCPRCQGRGQITLLPDLDRQKVALELAQLTQKSGGIVVQQQTTVTQPQRPLQAPGALEQLQQAVSQILYHEPITLSPDADEPPAEVDEPPADDDAEDEPEDSEQPDPSDAEAPPPERVFDEPPNVAQPLRSHPGPDAA